MDKINPEHYRKGKVETIDCISSVVTGYSGEMAYLLGNVVKYIARAPYKENMQVDLEKAQWCLDKVVEMQIAPINKDAIKDLFKGDENGIAP